MNPPSYPTGIRTRCNKIRSRMLGPSSSFLGGHAPPKGCSDHNSPRFTPRHPYKLLRVAYDPHPLNSNLAVVCAASFYFLPLQVHTLLATTNIPSNPEMAQHLRLSTVPLPLYCSCPCWSGVKTYIRVTPPPTAHLPPVCQHTITPQQAFQGFHCMPPFLLRFWSL